VVTFRSPSTAENKRQSSSSSSSSSSTSSELDYRLFLDFVMAFDALRDKQPPLPSSSPPPIPATLSANPSTTSPVLETGATAVTDNLPHRGSDSIDSSSSSGGSGSESGDASNGSGSGVRSTKSVGAKNVSVALWYFWPLLDVQHCGYLDSSTLAYLFGSVRRRLVTSGANGRISEAGGGSGDEDEANAAAAPLVGDVLDEIFDMVKPQGNRTPEKKKSDHFRARESS